MKYVLVYKMWNYLKSCNPSFGSVDLTMDIEKAKLLSLDEAEEFINRMIEPKSWKIYSVKNSLALDKESIRHTIRAKRKRLEEELAKLPPE